MSRPLKRFKYTWNPGKKAPSSAVSIYDGIVEATDAVQAAAIIEARHGRSDNNEQGVWTRPMPA